MHTIHSPLASLTLLTSHSQSFPSKSSYLNIPKIIRIQIRPPAKRKSYGSGSSIYRRVVSNGCNPAAKRLRGNDAVLYELEEEDCLDRQRESHWLLMLRLSSRASQAAPNDPSFFQKSQNDPTSTIDGDNGAQDGSECDDINPGPWIPPQGWRRDGGKVGFMD